MILSPSPSRMRARRSMSVRKRGRTARRREIWFAVRRLEHVLIDIATCVQILRALGAKCFSTLPADAVERGNRFPRYRAGGRDAEKA